VFLCLFVICTANGYARSEAACVMFLQKARDAKRVYATVVHAKNSSDGFKDQGILHPSRNSQKLLLEQCYQECGTDPRTVKYFEAHGTATKVCFIQVQSKSLPSAVNNYVLMK
jgi:fatty acid synthase